MIFVTVGTQLPFDRLVLAVDAWAAAHPDVEVFAQTGPTGHPPKHLRHVEFLKPARAEELMRNAELIVAHAGIGSIVSALRFQRPIVVMPRRADQREHRNDHQLATAKRLVGRPGVFVVWDADELANRLDGRDRLITGAALGPYAAGPLVDRLAAYIRGGPGAL